MRPDPKLPRMMFWLCLLALPCVLVAEEAQEAFRGRVIAVTNLQDSGVGTLRAALEAGGPRVVVFRIGGTLELEKPIHVVNPHAYVAGETAPGGICVKGEIEVGASGVTLSDISHCDGDAMGLLGILDTDGDGMGDAWERRAGLDWENPADGTWDRDADGKTHLQEYLVGSDARERRPPAEGKLLSAEDFAHHVSFFNAMEPERVINLVPNAAAWEWMQEQIPLFECPDAVLEEIYYFRWWALRKHLKKVGAYRVYTEFIELDTKAPFIPPERTIASALGHHFMETRWLRDQSADDEYLNYWMRGRAGGPQGHFHKYSSWLIESQWERALVTGDYVQLRERFPELLADYRRWQEEQQREDALYWQYDVWDAMEESISGSRREKNIRPTINSYMYGNALALAQMAEQFGKTELADQLRSEAQALRDLVLQTLWDPERLFFEVVRENGERSAVREAIGFIPWYFKLPPKEQGYEEAWKQLTDPMGFAAPYGITTAEIRHPLFRSHGVGTCEWDGAVWPYATSQTLGALANALRYYPGMPLERDDYMDAFLTYTRSQYYGSLPYIGEYQDERSGVWLKGRNPRSYYYHHSTFADLLITDVLGIVPSDGSELTIDPFVSGETWAWFCIQDVPYRGKLLTLFWDRDGSRYGRGQGLFLMVDGLAVAHSTTLGRLSVNLDSP